MRLPTIDKTKFEPTIENTYEVGNVEKFEFPTSLELDTPIIKKIEKLVRGSYEYQEYIRFLKEEINLDRCLILSGLSMDDVSIEMHHVGLTLYDIAYIVLNKYNQRGEDFTIFNVADELMHLHYKGMVMLCPLSLTIHQAVHSGVVMIPYQLAYGDLMGFYNEYKEYIPEDLQNKLKEWIRVSNEIIEEYDVPIMARKYTYLQIQGVSLPKKIE